MALRGDGLGVDERARQSRRDRGRRKGLREQQGHSGFLGDKGAGTGSRETRTGAWAHSMAAPGGRDSRLTVVWRRARTCRVQAREPRGFA
jgi:hypothetical protein